MSDAVTLIQQDHRTLAALLDRMRDPAADRATLVEDTVARATAHLRAEEKVYPILAGTDPVEYGEVHRGVPASGEVEERLRILRAADPDDAEFDRALRELTMVFTRHVGEEEAELLLHAGRRIDPDTLSAATAIFDARRRQELRVYGIDDTSG
ncbi:hemerythrin domain-containing protein [Solwaraspora sp. WMMD1047]|uniref:hemerythrin domain-containing protein n=1 Tax=Solwaraspora sp. WMMD1047 TaxID=3016102 RepID=UPI002415991D|nr:hemerythrin domain-containing protein [Solwaraspora sp. WMMD1047]MDG4831612.1 hemerythrin domain-containing protein [Solwaraspora sp. WMMD1047]